MRARVLLCLLAAVTVVGCATTMLTGPLPEIPDPDRTADLYLIRTNAFAGRAAGAIIAVDGDEIFQLGANQHTRLTVSADEYNREHSVAVNRRDQLNILCEPGGEYYFLIDMGMGGQLITQIAKQEADEWIAKTEFVELSGKPPGGRR